MALEDLKTEPVEITLDSQKFNIIYDFEAIKYLETITNMTIYEIKDLLLNNKLQLRWQVHLLYAGLLKHHPDISIKDLENRQDIGYLLNEISDLVVESFLKPLYPPEILEKIKNKTNDNLKKNLN